MKRLFSILFVATMLGMVFTSCGDDKDEPVVPTQKLESVYTAETDAHYLFDIDLNKDSSSIYLYHVKFSEQMPVTVDIRIDAPVTVDKSGKLFTYAGTNIIPYRLMGSTAVPAPGFIVTNLMCNVDTKRKYYEMYFECHGGSFAANGDLK